jgi:ATP-dependent DNA helicase PIF1
MKRKQDEVNLAPRGDSKCQKTEIEWSPSQLKAIEAVKTGKNTFISGSGGVGKSFLLNHLITLLKDSGKNVLITASTGVAAVPLGGTTLNYSMGVGLGDEPIPDLMKKLDKRIAIVQTLREIDAIFIDEISMVSSSYLDVCNEILKRVRNIRLPFGGVQVIVCGDFLQLPPPSGEYCFKSKCWTELKLTNIILTEVFRQKDKEFVELLNRVRFADITEEDIKKLKSCVGRVVDPSSGIMPLNMMAYNADVDTMNMKELSKLPGEPIPLTADEYFEDPDGILIKAPHLKIPLKVQLKSKIESNQTPPVIKVKTDARVILLKNLDFGLGLVNGSQGIITAFENNVPKVKFSNDVEILMPRSKETATVTFGRISKAFMHYEQYPLRLAWCLTHHKSQGATYPHIKASIDKKIHSCGQAYVVLSRVTTFEGLILDAFDPSVIKANQEAVKFYKDLQ